MLPDRVSNPGPLTYESGVLPIALRGPALNHFVSKTVFRITTTKQETTKRQVYPSYVSRFPPLHKKVKRNLSKIFDCNTDVYMYFESFCCEETIHHLTHGNEN